MNRRTILQKGSPGGRLYLHCHYLAAMIEPGLAERPDDTVVIEHRGEGTASYRSLLATYGGYDAWVAAIAAECETEGFSRVCLVTWSAGSQVAKDVCRGDALPEAILMMDGIYGDKPTGARRGDGKVVVDEGLEAIARYALAAANDERLFVLVHSEVPTPYASSSECAEAVRLWVERERDAPLIPDESADRSALGDYTRALAAGCFHLVGFPGTTGAEHLREGTLHDACRRLWL